MTKHDAVSVSGWDNCPAPVKEKVNNILGFLRQYSGNDLTGFYLHGSLTMNCFNPNTSDIDFLVVVEQKLTTQQKKDIIKYFRDIDSGAAEASPEMSIVTRESLKKLVYPSPFELHYSHDTRDDYTSGRTGWEEQRLDTDLPAHYAAIRERGIRLYGKPIEEVFTEIPQEMVIASIMQDLHWIRQQMSYLPFRHIILNPCRALAYIKEGIFLSKKEGGEWALHNLPQQYATMIEQALAAYSGVNDTAAPMIDVLAEFIDYAIKEFIYLASKTDAENIYFKRSY